MDSIRVKDQDFEFELHLTAANNFSKELLFD
jgi:hypothetical protein